jgi:hypothetical protein
MADLRETAELIQGGAIFKPEPSCWDCGLEDLILLERGEGFS